MPSLRLTTNVSKLTFDDKSRKGDVLPTLQEATREWVRLAWRRNRPDEEFSIPRLSEVTGIPLPALYRIEKLAGKASDRTIRKIAAALGTDPPVLTLDVSGLSEPVNALGWIGEAQAALERAAGLLRAQAIAAPAAQKTAKRAGRVKGPQPDGVEKGRGAA